LNEIQQVYEILMRIDAILNGIGVKSKKLQADAPKLKQATIDIRDLERLALRYLVLARRLGLPPEIDAALQKLSQMIISIRMAQRALTSLNASMYTNPVTAAIAIGGLALAAFSAYDLMTGV
jgi:hypothetical protein